MRNPIGVALSAVLACAVVCGQNHQVEVCDTFDGSDYHMVDSSVMGGVRFEDYKITNPAAVQFDPAQRVQELAALGTSTEDTLCESRPAFTTPVPTITFDKTSVVAQIYWVPVGPVDNSPVRMDCDCDRLPDTPQPFDQVGSLRKGHVFIAGT